MQTYTDFLEYHTKLAKRIGLWQADIHIALMMGVTPRNVLKWRLHYRPLPYIILALGCAIERPDVALYSMDDYVTYHRALSRHVGGIERADQCIADATHLCFSAVRQYRSKKYIPNLPLMAIRYCIHIGRLPRL